MHEKIPFDDAKRILCYHQGKLAEYLGEDIKTICRVSSLFREESSKTLTVCSSSEKVKIRRMGWYIYNAGCPFVSV